jgi:C-terminal processing protease CtpA/Prc
MKKFYLLLSALLLTSCFDKPLAQSVNPETDKVFLNGKYKSTAQVNEFTETGKQYYFIKVWGFLKYYGNFNGTDTDWDDYFLKNIGRVGSMDKMEYQNFIKGTISLFPKPEKKTIQNNEKDYCLIDNAWFGNKKYFNNDIAKSLSFLFINHNTADNEFAEQNRIGTINFTNEKKYNDSNYPEKNIRLLGLSRYWNIINYFYVYKNDMSENWDELLLYFIPKFSHAENTRQYSLAVQELSSKLYDCHSMIRSQYLDREVYGRYVPNFRVMMIDSTIMVKSLRVPNWDDGKVKIGDIILKIEGKNAIEKYREFNTIMKGANPLSEQRIICPYALSSIKNTMVYTLLRKGKEIEVVVDLKDYSTFSSEEKRIKNEYQEEIIIKDYPDSTAYINLDYISNSNFEENFDAARKYKNLIIDIRNYPHGQTTLNLISYIMPKQDVFFMNTYADVTSPGLLRKKIGYMLGSNNNSHYKGNVYVLVSEATQSEAEFLVMALQRNNKVKVVGSQSAGSDGNVQPFYFPGKIETVFTGLGIYYPDETPTQRRGIKIDVNVNQTLSGIAKGNDEILEKALSIIHKN